VITTYFVATEWLDNQPKEADKSHKMPYEHKFEHLFRDWAAIGVLPLSLKKTFSRLHRGRIVGMLNNVIYAVQSQKEINQNQRQCAGLLYKMRNIFYF
jgi:hypothetical protein